MSIQRAMAGLFGLGDGREVDALKASQTPERREGTQRRGVVEVPLYGEAAAIHALYQAAFLNKSAPKPPRPRKGRGSWVARYLNSFAPSLRGPAGAKA